MENFESIPTIEEISTEEENGNSNPERNLEFVDQNIECRNNTEENAILDSEKVDPVLQFISDNRGVSKEDLKLEHPDDGRYIYERDQILDKETGLSLTEQIRNSGDKIQLESHEALLNHLASGSEEPFMLLDHPEEQKTYFTVAKMDSERNIIYEIYSHEIKKEEEKPIDAIGGAKTREEDLNLEIDINIEKHEIADKEIAVDASLSVETETTTEETVEQTQTIIEEEVNLSTHKEASDHAMEVNPVITLATEHVEPNIVSSVDSIEKLVIQDSAQTVEQSAAETIEKEVDKQITERILDLLKDEPVAVIETPDILEKTEEDKVQAKIPELQTPLAKIIETIEPIQVTQESISSLETTDNNEIIENVITFAEASKNIETAEIEEIKPDTIAIQPDAEIIEPADKSVISPYIDIEISTIFKTETKDTAQEILVVAPIEKTIADTIDTPVNTIMDTAKNEIQTEIEIPQEIQIVETETAEQAAIRQTAEPVLAADEIKGQMASELAVITTEKEEVAIENTVREAIEIFPNPMQETVQSKAEVTLTDNKEIKNTEISPVHKADTAEINNAAKGEFAELQSNTTKKTAPLRDKTEKNLPIDGHEMLLRILGLPTTKKEINSNESIKTGSIPYSVVEADNTNIKPTGNQSKIPSTLNGITLKRSI